MATRAVLQRLQRQTQPGVLAGPLAGGNLEAERTLAAHGLRHRGASGGSMKPDKAKLAAGKFFMGIGRVKAQMPREEWSDFLFPLPLIMDAQGELAEDARHLVTDACDDIASTSNG
jgi:hypothetical protein